MQKVQLLYGMILGLLAAALGAFLFIELFTEYDFVTGWKIMKFQGNTGKIITLGALLNMGLFFLLIKLKKELIARGVLLATLLLAIYTVYLFL